MTYVIGLTGGIGSGKTLVSDHFSKLGVPIIDTDVIARQIVRPGQATLKKLINQFGESILLQDGQLDRAKLRAIAFSNNANKAALDSITHPAIRQKTFEQMNVQTQTYCLIVVPLLNTESTFIEFMQRILVVTADLETKIERIKRRSKLTDNEIRRIMKTQLDDQERLSFADDVINNNTSIESTYKQVKALNSQYLKLSFNE